MIEWKTYRTKKITGQYLFRYMKAKWLIEFIKTGNMNMARLDQFDDKMEGITTGGVQALPILKVVAEQQIDVYDDITRLAEKNAKGIARKVLSQVNHMQKSSYAVCWFLSDRESIAMWNLYSSPEGLAIRINREQLQNRVKDSLDSNSYPIGCNRMIAGRIRYQDFIGFTKNPKKTDKTKYLTFRKDVSYEHESEFRFCLQGDFNPMEYPKRFDFELGSLKGMDFELIAHPKMSNELFKSISETFEKLDYKIKFRKSELARFFEFIHYKID